MTIFADALEDILNDEGLKTAATYNGATIYGVFSNEFVLVDGVETRTPTFEAIDSDLTGAAHGVEIIINGTTYVITSVQPNGEGSTQLILVQDTIAPRMLLEGVGGILLE